MDLMSNMGEYQTKEGPDKNITQQWVLRNMILPKRKRWALDQRVSELLLSPKEGWRRMKWKLYAKVQRPEKRASSWEEGLSSLSEGEWAVAVFQRGMTQDEVKILW